MEQSSEDQKERISCMEGTKQLLLTVVTAVSVLATVGAIVTLIAHTGAHVKPILPFCETQVCVKEALGILNHIDLSVDPCKNFYAFACNNLPEFSLDGVDYQTPRILLERELLKLEKLYNEQAKNYEHDLVKAQKKMYKACMNEVEITENAFPIIQEILKKLGGWPVVEGKNWKETNFDWLETIYKLRELGYDFSTFLQVNIVSDPRHEENYIYELSLPYINDVYSKWFEAKEKNVFMADIAVVFGAQPHTALIEMNETYQFLHELRQIRNEFTNYHQMFRKTTIEKLQHKETDINWLQFLNKIVGPYAEIYEDDFVLVPSKKHLDVWLSLLQKTSKRTLANYMMWKVVEEVLPYLTEGLDKGGVRPKLMSHIQGKTETRSSFCINEIRKRFTPNPMEIMYVRRYLPEKKRRKVEEIIRNMKTEFGKIIKEVTWMNLEDKQDTVNRIEDMRVIVGVPASYFNDDIFDNMIVDGLINSNDSNFLTLLSQANKNNLDWLYSLINKTRSETKNVWKNLLSNVLEYNIHKNEMTIPATMVQDPTFNEKRPNYLNYARLGIALKDIFFKVLGKSYAWSNQTKEAFEQEKDCLILDKSIRKTVMFNLMMDDLIANILGIKISFQAYNEWAMNNHELSLIALNYTPQQLFWMVSEYMFCENTLGFSYSNLGVQAAQTYYSAVYKVVNNNLDLVQTFNCSIFHMNFKNICQIF